MDTLSSSAIDMVNEAYVTCCGLNVRELRVLRLTDDNPGITFSDLAAETRFERSLTSRLLSKLVKGGLIRRMAGKNDARQFNLHTTAKGREMCGKAAQIGGEMEEHFLTPLSAAERESLHSCIQKLTEWVDGEARNMIGQLIPPKRRSVIKKT
jgi:DNA-binding MarR family transcriptional regulator